MSPTKLRKLYEFSCLGKLRHENSLTALQHAGHLRLQFPERPWHVYACEFCSGLHVGRWKNRNRELTEEYDVCSFGTLESLPTPEPSSGLGMLAAMKRLRNALWPATA